MPRARVQPGDKDARHGDARARQWSDLALSALGEAGHRAGGARRAVVAQLAREDCCVTAQQIDASLREAGERVGIASVYRALDALQAIGVVQRVEVGDGATRYEAVVPGGDHHHHLLCDSCGRLSAFEDEALERAIGDLEARLGVRVHGHEVLIHGECRRCEQRS